MPSLGPTSALDGFKEKPDLLNDSGVGLVVVMELCVAAHFIEMLLIVDRRADDFAWIGDRAEELKIFEGRYRQRSREGSVRGPVMPPRLCDEQVVRRKRITITRQCIQGGRDIAHTRIFDQTNSAIPKPAKSHQPTPSLSLEVAAISN